MRSPSKVGGIHPEGPHVTSRACEARRQGRFRARKPNVGNLSRPTRRCTSDRSRERDKRPFIVLAGRTPRTSCCCADSTHSATGRSLQAPKCRTGRRKLLRPAGVTTHHPAATKAVGQLRNSAEAVQCSAARAAPALELRRCIRNRTERRLIVGPAKNLSSNFHIVRKQPLPTKACPQDCTWSAVIRQVVLRVPRPA